MTLSAQYQKLARLFSWVALAQVFGWVIVLSAGGWTFLGTAVFLVMMPLSLVIAFLLAVFGNGEFTCVTDADG